MKAFALLFISVAAAYGCCLVDYEDKNCESCAPIETHNWPPNKTHLDICFNGNRNNASKETCQSNCKYLESCDDAEALDDPTKYYVAGWEKNGVILKCCKNRAIEILYCAETSFLHDDSALKAAGENAADGTMLIKDVTYYYENEYYELTGSGAPRDASVGVLCSFHHDETCAIGGIAGGSQGTAAKEAGANGATGEATAAPLGRESTVAKAEWLPY